MNTSKVNNVKKHVTFGPNRPEYKELEARMASFERRSWPPSIPIKPSKLAEAGFYYTGCNDEAKCFYCEGIIHSWEANDDPWEEHATLYPRCGFLNRCYKTNKDLKSENDSLSNKESCPTNNDTDVNENKTNAKRASDEKSCIIELLRKKFDDDKESEILSYILGEMNKVEELTLCKICQDLERKATFNPCGHFVCCLKCAMTLKQCPICRISIQSVSKTHMS